MSLVPEPPIPPVDDRVDESPRGSVGSDHPASTSSLTETDPPEEADEAEGSLTGGSTCDEGDLAEGEEDDDEGEIDPDQERERDPGTPWITLLGEGAPELSTEVYQELREEGVAQHLNHGGTYPLWLVPPKPLSDVEERKTPDIPGLTLVENYDWVLGPSLPEKAKYTVWAPVLQLSSQREGLPLKGVGCGYLKAPSQPVRKWVKPLQEEASSSEVSLSQWYANLNGVKYEDRPW
jgi:hypothetical protein